MLSTAAVAVADFLKSRTEQENVDIGLQKHLVLVEILNVHPKSTPARFRYPAIMKDKLKPSNNSLQ
jgi:hypothetical protein